MHTLYQNITTTFHITILATSNNPGYHVSCFFSALMAPTAPDSADTISPDWLQDSRNEDDELANNDDFTKEIPPDAGTEVTITVAAADSVARRFPHNNNLDPNGRAICTHKDCGKTFGCTTALHRHEEKHNPHWLHCEQCNYSTYQRDMLQNHQDSRHKHNQDRLRCQRCNYETCREDNLRKHQKRCIAFLVISSPSRHIAWP
jgi:hypothetical protein